MCPASWELLDMITQECDRLSILLLVQSDDMDRIKIHQDSVKTFEELYGKFEAIEKDLPRLNEASIEEIIIANAQKYRTSF